ncbi:hypothetical protein AX15_003752 [Amanita polypyramis BW_CC]|nr:hypothetical protein AX15_003752 [Amanita polypyramis BW_CC]
MHTEFWLTYYFSSRGHLPPTTQLIELESLEHKLTDLEDVLEHVFRQGFVDPKHRPGTWWEKKDGVRVKASATIEFLLHDGVGTCPETALKLIIEDVPTSLWFSYVYIHKPHAQIVTQRIKFAHLQKRFEKVAHVTNYVFGNGFLPSKYRAVVHWEGPCGKSISEFVSIDEILATGDGISEEKPLRLVIDDKLVHEPCTKEPIHQHQHHYYHHHHPYTSCPSSPSVTAVSTPVQTTVPHFH